MSRSRPPRLLLFVLGGIVGRIIVGKNRVGLVVVEKFGYIAFVVKVAIFVIMSVHNSEHNSPLNFDHDDDIHDSITRISKLDISDPLHLHPNDTTALTVVSIKLKGIENYQVWSCAMLLALEGKYKIGFINRSCKRSNTYEVLGKQWDRVNAIVLGWILNSISGELFLGQIFSKKAKHVWEELKETYDKVDGSIMFGLHNQINTLKQNGSSIPDYYHKLNALWKQYDAMIELPKCVCNASEGFKKHNHLLKLMQFIMGLDESYMQIRSSILSRETLPDVRSAYATISSEESHRVAVGSIAGSSHRNQASAFVSNVPYSQNFQRNNQNFNVGPSRPNKKKSGQNFKKQSVSNNNSVGKSSSYGFTDEQMATLFSLIKDNKVGKNIQANMAGANQHTTYTDKELDNVIDISHLKIKVGHLNGTEAYIFKIGNLKLSNGLTLYDVIVIPEYCITLISVHKLIKENKVIVAFDENRCYFLNQDLNLKNVMGIGEQCEGLLGHPADPVLNVLKDSLNFDKKDNTGCCEICQRAKQTREPFPLSDHKSKSLGDLVHLDLWGPYKVTSSEGFRFFLTVVDDYTRAVWVYLIKSKDEDSEVRKNDSTHVLQDVDHINFFDIEYPEIPNDDERVANDLNKGKSDSSNSSESGSNIITADFPVDYGNDADSSNDFVVKYGLEKFVSYSKLNTENFCFITQLNKIREPKTYFEASKYSHWIEVMNQEMNALLRNGTWELVELPEGRKAIGSKWIYKIKFRSSGEINRYKARLVAQGFGQKEGIDYEEIFSTVVKMVTIRCLLNIVVSMSWSVFQLDVNNAFLYGDLEEVVYMKPPEGYFPFDNNFEKGVFLALLVYVDDIIITGNSVSEIEKFKVFLKSKFMIKDLGKLKYFLGIEVVDNDKGICLNQRKYVLDLLSEYGMLACKPEKTPLMSKLVISNEASDKDHLLENITDYQELMRKLIYLTNTRPYIFYVVHCLSQFMHSPLTSHLKIAFKILRYLKRSWDVV
ncbi:ribonuclease H-like domain-containing protein [Tanacetum coccineum]